MPGLWTWPRSAAPPALASTIEIRLSEATKEYLIDIWISTQARWGEAQADSCLDELARALRLLADNLREGVDCTHVLPGTRRLIVGWHAAFYRIRDNRIRILRVPHQSMDSAAHLKNI